MDEKDQLQRSWIANAPAWRDAVRERKIDSRRVATDAAIIDAVMSLAPVTVLDLGCGEGWLARELRSREVRVVGIDASRPLIDAATELGGGSFYAISYEDVISTDSPVAAPFDVVVANFSILEEDMRPILTAAAQMLKSAGTFVIQTVHPAFAVGDAAYSSGWRTETFAALDGEWPEPMPWYFRTLSDWVRALSENGFAIAEMREPLDAKQSRPLSMIFICRAGSRSESPDEAER